MGSKQPGNVDKDDGYFKYYVAIGPVDYKKSVYNGLMMASGIIGTSYVLKKCCGSKYVPPHVSMNDYFSLATVTILSQIGIDYGKVKGKIPYGLT